MFNLLYRTGTCIELVCKTECGLLKFKVQDFQLDLLNIQQDSVLGQVFLIPLNQQLLVGLFKPTIYQLTYSVNSKLSSTTLSGH